MMRRKQGKRLAVRVIRVILAVILLMNVFVMLLSWFGAEEQLSKMPFALLEVSGGSMEPMLHDGDGILTVRKPFSGLRVGDVITFKRDGELITHEIVSRNEYSVTTKGTANNAEDAPVLERDYCAKLLLRFPGMRLFWRTTSSAPRFLLFTVLLILLLFGTDIFPAVYSAVFERKKDRR